MSSTDYEPISDQVIARVTAALDESRPVRELLPGGGQLNMDRLLPFLCVYRRDPQRVDPGTALFITAEAAYLNAPGVALRRPGLRKLVRRIAETASARLGAFLVLEIWSGDDRDVPHTVDDMTGEPLLPQPGFRIITRLPHHPEGTVSKLEFALQQVKVHRKASDVTIVLQKRTHPTGMQALISEAEAERLNCHVLGLEIRPLYRNQETGDVYQELLRRLRRSVSRALKQAFFTFALNRTNVRPQHYYVMGRRTLPQLVWSVDRQLADVSSQFKFLLLTTPVNAERTWHTFAEQGYQEEPRFVYRPVDSDPLLLKRKLLRIRTEQIEDPTLEHVFRQTQDELERQITMLTDIGTRRFLPGSLQVFGEVAPSLAELATQILTRLACPETPESRRMSAREFAKRANREIQYYRQSMNDFAAQAIVRNDMYSGLLSTGGNLLIGRETALSANRADALLQHEVGTHLVTYYNGAAQPLKLLRVGLAGYDGLQEGLAVLSEYLVGGLSRSRLRTLAARVIATDRMARGTALPEVFHTLTQQFGFEPHTAYTIALRVYRGGGLTKDAVYLRGLVEILDYLRGGGQLEPLLVGKLAVDHIPIVRELLLRGVLRPPPLRPRWLDHPLAAERLAAVRRPKRAGSDR